MHRLALVLALALGADPQAPAPKPAAAASSRAPTKSAIPKPAPTPPPVLEGIVKGPDGKPVEDAFVSAQLTGGSWSEKARTTRTDVGGRFRLELASAGLWNLQVEAADLAPVRRDKLTPGARLVLVLERGRTIEGFVRDEDGRPISGARVFSWGHGWGVSPWETKGGGHQATTDGEGRFRIAGVAPGLQTVAALARGFRKGYRNAVLPGSSSVVLTLRRGGWIGGTATDVAGHPIPRARIRAELEPQLLQASNTELADARGRFELPGLSAGSYTLVAQQTDFAPTIVTGVSVGEEGSSEAPVVLVKGAAVLGRLVDGEGHGVKGRVRVVSLAGRDLPSTAVELLTTETTADGHFRIEHVGPGSWTLAASARGFATQPIDAEVSGKEPSQDLGDVALTRGLTLRGHVRTAAGAPVGGANIMAFQEALMVASAAAETRSEDDGSFVLAGLTAARYMLSVSAPGFARFSKSLTPGAEAASLVLTPGGTITGVVVDDAGRPVDSYQVIGDAESQEVRSHGGNLFESVGSVDGRFTLDDVAEATYVLQILCPDHPPATVPGVSVAAGRTRDIGVVRLPRGGTVQGTVADVEGAAVAGATVQVSGPGFEMMRSMDLLEATTDSGGSFEIRGVPTGDTRISASHPDFTPTQTTVHVDASQGASSLTITLGRGGRIEGSARRRDGMPLSGLSVRATTPSRGADRGALTLADGSFTLEHVPTGQVELLLMANPAPGVSISILSKVVEVREGETTLADLVSHEVLVSGHVTRSGAPLPAVDLRLWGATGTSMSMSVSGTEGVPRAPAGPEHLHAISGEDGAFELIVGEPGKYWLNASSVDGRVTYPGRELNIQDVDAQTVDIAFSGAPVSGIVVDKETTQAVQSADVWARAKSPKAAGGGGARSGADGRFAFDLEPGDYALVARAEGYAEMALDGSVGEAGLSDLRFEMVHGQDLAGRIVDASGRGAGQVSVMALAPGQAENSHYGQSVADGSFRFSGLADKPYNVCGGSAETGFAVRARARPGDSDIVLRLQPAARLRLLVRGQDGAPVAGAMPRVTKVDGVEVSVPTMGIVATSASGAAELAGPPGNLEIVIRGESRKATLLLAVAPGGHAESEVVLTDPLDDGD